MGAHQTFTAPVIATGLVFATYLDAIRTNAANLLRCTQALRDAEAEREAQLILDTLNDAAVDLEALINAGDAKQWARDEDQFWRESIHADRAGMGEAA